MKINHVSLDEIVHEESHPMKIIHISLGDNILRRDFDFCQSESLLNMNICFGKDGTKERKFAFTFFCSILLVTFTY